MLYTTDLFSMYKFTGHPYHKAAQEFVIELSDSIKKVFIEYDKGYRSHSRKLAKNVYDALDYRYDHFLMTVMSSYNIFLGLQVTPTYVDEVIAPVGWILHYKNRCDNTIISHVHVEECYRGNDYGKFIYKSLQNDVSKEGSICELIPVRTRKNLYDYCEYLKRD